MNPPIQGTTRLLELAKELRELAPHVAQAYDLTYSSRLMVMAADSIDALAYLDPDIDSEPGEN